MAVAAVMWLDIGFAGAPTFEIQQGQNTSAIAPPMGADDGQGSSMIVPSSTWITFWELPNFDGGGDSLWIESAGPGFQWRLDNLHQLRRPHGNNHWGDRIRAVSFSGPP